MNTHLDDHERRISHSLYGGLEGLDDNLMPRQGMIPRTIGKTDTFFLTYSLWLVRLLIAADHSAGFLLSEADLSLMSSSGVLLW